MGNWVTTYFIDPEHSVDQRRSPRFDPLYGFPNGRKPREMVATVEEMDAAKIPPKKRDYCAHYYMRFLACKKRNFGFQYRCGHEKHDYDYCQFEDFVLRMKEYERERRLLQRQKRKEARMAA